MSFSWVAASICTMTSAYSSQRPAASRILGEHRDDDTHATPAQAAQQDRQISLEAQTVDEKTSNEISRHRGDVVQDPAIDRPSPRLQRCAKVTDNVALRSHHAETSGVFRDRVQLECCGDLRKATGTDHRESTVLDRHPQQRTPLPPRRHRHTASPFVELGCQPTPQG